MTETQIQSQVKELIEERFPEFSMPLRQVVEKAIIKYIHGLELENELLREGLKEQNGQR